MPASYLSAFDLFRIGIGPSSSHTVGPMRAASRFLALLADRRTPTPIERIQVCLYGSLGATGKGHGTDRAVLLGLAGERPDAVPAERVDSILTDVAAAGRLRLASGEVIDFDPERDIVFLPHERMTFHPNALRFDARTPSEVVGGLYYSIGGGFVVSADEAKREAAPSACDCPYPFATAAELLVHCARTGRRISDVVRANEEALRPADDVTERLAAIARAMADCIDAGCHASGVLPGGLGVPRRAGSWFEALSRQDAAGDPLAVLDWVSLFALAVNEENAAGHRVVTAPTNGAAGVVPAVLTYYRRFVSGSNDDGVARFLLAASAVGGLIKRNASIAGAEVGCQGEVGAACAMAAAGLTEVMGGTPLQVENAAEIAMEHNLGLTCDPVGGLVQIPCIERNAIAAVKAINASRMALRGDGRHTVSLDAVIATMRQTGLDMHSKYKETSEGGLAVNIIEC